MRGSLICACPLGGTFNYRVAYLESQLVWGRHIVEGEFARQLTLLTPSIGALALTCTHRHLLSSTGGDCLVRIPGNKTRNRKSFFRCTVERVTNNHFEVKWTEQTEDGDPAKGTTTLLKKNKQKAGTLRWKYSWIKQYRPGARS